MKLQVIGHKGVVGGATYGLFKRLGYDVVGSDIGDQLYEADLHFICTPEETAMDVVNGVRKKANFDYDRHLIVVRSSVLPGTCKGYVSSPKTHICHNPEFLREAMAVQDTFSPSMVVIGECCKKHGDVLKNLYRPLRVPIVKTDTTTSELVKLSVNCYLSCLISYWNEIEKIACKLGISGHQVGMIASMDPRVSKYGARFHQKYGGRCLPKDMRHILDLINVLWGNRVAPSEITPLLSAIEEVNNSLGGE